MAASSSSSSNHDSRILCASFNQDSSCFAIGTKDGFRLFDARSGRLRYERVIIIATSSLSLQFCHWQCTSRTEFFDHHPSSSFKSEKEKTYIYDVNSLAILDTIDTVPNNKGLCAFSPNSEACLLALPASTTKGSVIVYSTLELQSLCQIDAHRSPLAAIVFSSNGMYLATASEQGTIIRVHLVSQATKSYSLRRGSYPSIIYSLSFGPSVGLPDILVGTSLSGSLHAFSLEPIIKQRDRRPNKLIGSIFPEPINDAFESSYHHVVHKASLAGVKSYVTISSTDKVQSTSPNSTLRSNVYIITGNGHFYNYTLDITSSNELSWSLQSEFNLIDTAAEDP